MRHATFKPAYSADLNAQFTPAYYQQINAGDLNSLAGTVTVMVFGNVGDYGTANIALIPITLTGLGGVYSYSYSGTVLTTLDHFTLEGAGVHGIAGNGVLTSNPIELTGTGILGYQGTLYGIGRVYGEIFGNIPVIGFMDGKILYGLEGIGQLGVYGTSIASIQNEFSVLGQLGLQGGLNSLTQIISEIIGKYGVQANSITWTLDDHILTSQGKMGSISTPILWTMEDVIVQGTSGNTGMVANLWAQQEAIPITGVGKIGVQISNPIIAGPFIQFHVDAILRSKRIFTVHITTVPVNFIADSQSW